MVSRVRFPSSFQHQIFYVQVSQMEIEVQGIPQSIRPQYQTRLKSSKAELSRYKKLCKDSYAQLSRSDLLSSSRQAGLISNSDDPYTSDRTRLLSGTVILEDSTRRLQDSHRIALETEVRGAETLDILRQQREQIEHARDTVCFSFFRVLRDFVSQPVFSLAPHS
jgi:vesicle transport through interaction with t-SNAREs protein 1